VKLSFDSDKAGLAATERAIELGQKLGLTLRMIELPDGFKDPDEVCAADPELWKQAIASAKYIVDYLFDRFEQDYDLKSLIGKRQYTDRLAATLRRLGDPVERDHYVKILAQKVGVSEEAVREKVAAEPIDRNRSQQPMRAVVRALGKPTARETIEQMVLSIALTHMPARIILQDLREHDFSTAENVAMFHALSEHEDVEAEILAVTLTDLAKSINILRLVGEQQFALLSPADRSIEAFDLARRLHDLSNRQLKQSLINQLRDAETNGELDMVDRLTRKIQTLNEEES
jgi:DNA primase